MADTPKKNPWGELLDQARRRAGVSTRQAAQAAGMSEARWRQIVNGYQSAGAGQIVLVEGPDDTLAKMAHVVGVTPDQLRAVGRARAAAQLEGLAIEVTPEGLAQAEAATGRMFDPDLADFTDAALFRELEARSLYRAIRLQARGEKSVGYGLDGSGLLEMVTQPPRRGD